MENRKKWLPFIEIYFTLWRYDKFEIEGRKQSMSERRRGRPKRLDFTNAKSAWLKSQAEHIRETTYEELSVWAWPQFYLQCTGYRKGGAELLKWCEQHLPSKNSGKEWGFSLMEDQVAYLGSVLENPMFLKKQDFVHAGRKYLAVHGKKVFIDPFSYILERAWVWNSAMEYCLEVCKNLGIKGSKLVALRSSLYQLFPQMDIHTEKELATVLTTDQGLKGVRGYNTATKQIQRAKRFISKKLK